MIEPRTLCPGCHRAIVAKGTRCPACSSKPTRVPDTRPSRSQRGYTRQWYDSYQKPYLRQHPLCEECAERGIVKPAECVDHKTPHKGDAALLYCWENLRALCWSCHSRKTRREQGGRPS